MAWVWFHRLGSPPYVYGLAARLTPWFAWGAAALGLAAGIAAMCALLACVSLVRHDGRLRNA